MSVMRAHREARWRGHREALLEDLALVELAALLVHAAPREVVVD